MDVDERLLEYANPRQADAIRAYVKHGSYAEACQHVEPPCTANSLSNLISRVKRKAAAAGFAPEQDMSKYVGDPYVMSGKSTLVDAEGKPVMTWVKTKLDHQKYLDLVREMIDELKKDIPACPPVELSSEWDQPDELLNFHVLSDIHLGALSWAEETGADWDLDIAEATILDAFRYLIARSPPAKRGFLCQLGDGLHYDSLKAMTPGHGHILDADSRYHKIVRASLRIFRRVIYSLLEKHEEVDVVMAMGNHDEAGSVWLQESFAMLFEDNPRCNVIVNPSPYYAAMHGRTFLGMHHGHKANMKTLGEVFNGKKYWPMLGDARQAYIHTGHQHHREVKEWNGGIIEMHQTLAAPSSYEAHGGWDADRSMTCITYHKSGKEHSRTLYYPETHDAELSKAPTDAQGSVSAA